MLTKEEIIKTVTKANIFENKMFTKVWLVGSFARNEATDKSDIDFLIEYDIDKINSETVTHWTNAISFIEKTFNRKAQLISTEAYERFGNSKEILIK